MTNRKLQHNHLIDGKYLKEDVLPQLRDSLFALVEWRVAECVKPDVFMALNDIIEQFEDECVAYDRSNEFTATEKKKPVSLLRDACERFEVEGVYQV